MTADVSDLRAMVKGLQYPGNQDYDPETLQPDGDVTRKRVALMERNMPELLAGGESLLDIGSSKGFVCFHLRDKFKQIDGYEVSHARGIAEEVRNYHGLDHIGFHQQSFRQIPLHKGFVGGFRTWDTVYCGSVHHHFFKDAMLHRAPFHLPLKKLAALAERLLILDGPIEFGEDCSLNTWAKQFKWRDSIRNLYTLESHVKALKPQFKLIRGPNPNERGRTSLVFQRVAPNIPTRTMTEDDILRTRRGGEVVRANNARETASVVRMGDVRYKFDKGVQNDSVFLVLNSLPDWFLNTRELLIDEAGNRIGDVSEWVEGTPNSSAHRIGSHWLWMNDILACVGLVEIHLKQGDYVLRDGRYIDVDVDMVNHVDRIATANDYLAKWRTAGAKDAFGERLAATIADNLADEWIFRKALAEQKAQK